MPDPFDDLQKLKSLKKNWDGQGGLPPTPRAINAAIDFIDNFLHPAFRSRIKVVALNNGGLCLWCFEDQTTRGDVEIHFTPNGHIRSFVVVASFECGPESHGHFKKMMHDLKGEDGKIDFEKAKDLIGDTTNTVPGSGER